MYSTGGIAGKGFFGITCDVSSLEFFGVLFDALLPSRTLPKVSLF